MGYPLRTNRTATIAAGLALFTATAPASADEPLAPISPPGTEEVEPAATSAPWIVPECDEVALEAGVPSPQPIPTDDPGDAGSHFTDAGQGRPAGTPDALERAKFAMARAAVARSRDAGTLNVATSDETIVPPSEAACEAAKLALLRGMLPQEVEVDPAAGLGTPVEPRREDGPAGLTADEERKLAEALGRATTVDPGPPPADSPREDAAR